MTRPSPTDTPSPYPTYTPSPTPRATPVVATIPFPDWVLSSVGGADESTEIALDVDRNLLFVAPGAHLYVYDVSDPTHPRALGQTHMLEWSARASCATDMATVGDYVYIGDCGGHGAVHIVDVRDPVSPVVVGSTLAHLAVGGGTSSGGHGGGAAYSLLEWDGLLVVGVSLSAQDQHGDWVADRGQLVALNLADPVHPVREWVVPMEMAVRSVAAAGRVLAVARESEHGYPLAIVDPDAASQPREVATVEFGGLTTALAASDTHAYAVVLNGTGLPEDAVQVIDLSDPARISSTAALTYTVEAKDGWRHFPWQAKVRGALLAIAEGYNSDLDVAESIAALQLYDLVADGQPRLRGWVSTELPNLGADLALDDDTAFVSGTYGRVAAVDIRDRAHPQVVGNIVVPTLIGAVRTGEQLPERVFAGDAVLDITEPALPRVLARWPGGTLSGRFAYRADREFGLRIAEIADNGTSRDVGELETPGYALSVAVDGRYAYVAHTGPNTKGTRWQGPDPAYRLLAVDVSDPTVPRSVVDLSAVELAAGHVPLGTDCCSVSALAVGSSRLAMSLRSCARREPSDIIVIRPSAPSACCTRYSDTFGRVAAMTLEGCTLYARQGESGECFRTWGGELIVADVCDAAGTPREIARLPLHSASPGTLDLHGDRLYVADDTGLLIVDVRDPRYPRPVLRLASPFPLTGAAPFGDHLYVGSAGEGLFVATDDDRSSAHVYGRRHLKALCAGPWQPARKNRNARSSLGKTWYPR